MALAACCRSCPQSCCGACCRRRKASRGAAAAGWPEPKQRWSSRLRSSSKRCSGGLCCRASRCGAANSRGRGCAGLECIKPSLGRQRCGCRGHRRLRGGRHSRRCGLRGRCRSLLLRLGQHLLRLGGLCQGGHGWLRRRLGLGRGRCRSSSARLRRRLCQQLLGLCRLRQGGHGRLGSGGCCCFGGLDDMLRLGPSCSTSE